MALKMLAVMGQLPHWIDRLNVNNEAGLTGTNLKCRQAAGEGYIIPSESQACVFAFLCVELQGVRSKT